MLGDSATLSFLPTSAAAQPVTIQAPEEWADRAYVELPDAEAQVHSTFYPEILRVLKRGAKICIRHRRPNNGKSCVDLLVFAGFVDAVETDTDGVTFETTAAKPNWNQGAAMPLSLKKKKTAATPTPKPAEEPSNNAKKVWTISADDGEDLMDEDSLLEDSTLTPKPKPASDCSTSRKACKNCSCGRAEMEENGDTTAQPTSACGNCYLGDGFRCAGCPYRGQPPFKPGDKVQISLD